MATILLIEATVYDPTIPGEFVIRVSTGGGYRHPSAPGPYRDGVLQRSRFRREIFAEGAVFGAGSGSYGPLRLVNREGWLDWLEENDCATDGRPLVMLVGEEKAAYETFVPIFTGTMERILLNDEYAEIRISDTAAQLLDEPIQKVRFAGTNVNPNGVEGVDDLRDQWKPWLNGYVFNAQATVVNTWKPLIQISDEEISDVLAMRFAGAPQVKGTERADLATLLATTPVAGQYDYYLGAGGDGSYARPGSMPTGAVTVDAIAGAATADRTPAQCIKRALLRKGVDAGDIAAGDVTALDAAAPYDCGLWVGTTETKTREVVDRYAQSAAAGVWQDALGKWRMAQITAPAGSPVASFKMGVVGRSPLATSEADILLLEPLFTGRTGAGIPPHTIAVRYARNHSPMDRNAIVGVALADAQRLASEYYTRATPEDAAIKAKHPSSTPFTLDTLIRTEADAIDLAEHLESLFGTSRRRYSLRVQLTSDLAAVVDLGKVVKVTWPRYGLDSGKLFLVTALEIDALTLVADLIIWG